MSAHQSMYASTRRRPEESGSGSSSEPASLPAMVAVPAVARQAAGADVLGGTEAAPEVDSALNRLRGRGFALSTKQAEPLGRALGADLSGVRLHTDGEAQRLTRSVDAEAFTHGRDIYFGAGAYAPDTPAGQHLLAHELGHVVQGSANRSAGGSTTIGRADDPAEVEAEAMADRAVHSIRSGGPARSAPAMAGSGGIARMIRRGPGGRKKKGGAVDVNAIAEKVAAHAWENHKDEFSADMSESEFKTLVGDLMMGAVGPGGVEKALANSRVAYYNKEKNVLVIYNGARPEQSTCFRPDRGQAYVNGLT